MKILKIIWAIIMSPFYFILAIIFLIAVCSHPDLFDDVDMGVYPPDDLGE